MACAITCGLCNGRKGKKDKRRNIAIIAHGNGVGWYTAARSDLNVRRQGLLPIINNR
jgi:hypothetical protein